MFNLKLSYFKAIPLWVALLTACWSVPSWSASKDWEKGKGLFVIVGSPYVELYVFPGRGFPKFHAIEKNEKIRIFKSRGGWYKVETEGGKEGWVRRRDLHTVYDEEGYLLDFSTPSWDDPDYPWQLGLMGGAMDGVTSYSVYTGYRFTRNLSTELKYTQAFGNSSNLKLASVMLVHQAYPEWRVSPFFTMGAGILQTFPDAILVESEDRQDSAITVGGGLFMYINYRVMSRLAYNAHTVLTNRENNLEVNEWKAGFSVLF